MSESSLLVFAKSPVAGKVKTRLIGAMSAQAATNIYEQLLSHTLKQATAVETKVVVWRAGDAKHAYWQQWPELSFSEQAKGDLGHKMSHAISASLVSSKAVVVVGSDCLALTTAYIKQAFEALSAGVDVVLGPAVDGGYVLIGMSQPQAVLFEGIEWSSDQVLSQTLAVLKQQNLSHTLLPVLNDIDTVEDAIAAGLFSAH